MAWVGNANGLIAVGCVAAAIALLADVRNCRVHWRLLSLALLAGSLAGCASMGASYAPRPAFALDQDIKELHDEFADAASIKAYYLAGAETRDRRNSFIAGRLTLYDLEYIRFLSRFRFGRAAEATAFDSAALGVGFATTIVSGDRAKTILGAVTTVLTGERASYEKNFYDDKTAAALVSQMNAERKTALIPIVAGAGAAIEEYPLSRAIVDLTNYQFAGSVDGALAGVQRDAGEKDAKATATLNRYRAVSFAPDDATERLQSWLFPGLSTFDATGIARDKAGAVVAVDTNRLAQLQGALKKLKLDGIPVAVFLVAGTLADARATVVKDLAIQ